ncbi:MAG: TrmH family RNA methyltransferase, partial [Spirochaetales bacterium]|nr:TrmH family RNA methyltransferase [Spirochaetales bacterium]
MNLLDRVIIVLCRPEGSMNIGAVCRGMANMGLSRLRLVGDMSHLDEGKIKMMGLHAYGIYEEAGRFETLSEALKDTVLASGITRRRGKNRKRLSRLPEDLAAHASSFADGNIALVFGNEQNG